MNKKYIGQERYMIEFKNGKIKEYLKKEIKKIWLLKPVNIDTEIILEKLKKTKAKTTLGFLKQNNIHNFNKIKKAVDFDLNKDPRQINKIEAKQLNRFLQ